VSRLCYNRFENVSPIDRFGGAPGAPGPWGAALLSLRSRLTLFFVLAVVVPVLALTLSVTLDRPPGGDLDRRLPLMLAMLTVAFCAVATLLGALLARLVSEPLHQLAAQARAIARGDFANPPSAVRSTGEIGELARAFDSMRVDLGAYVSAVRTSRDELSRAMTRLGQTLSSTHDLPRLLAVVLEAAVRSRQGVAGSVLLLSVDRASLVRQASFGLPAGELAARMPVGHGIAGTVAASGRPVVVAAAHRDAEPGAGAPAPGAARAAATAGASGSPGGGTRAAAEPAASTQVSVPLVAQGRVLGVLSVYERETGEPFTLEDATVLADFAVQAAVAVENVQLHEEAERLSLTDAVTGSWNYRYFERRLEQELERSRRFGRLFALLLLDIDHFKLVNDRHGHQVGDEVLVEMTRRITAIVRDIDTFARYGGEEFVLILPETNLVGGIAVAEKLRGAVAAAPFAAPPGGDGVRLTVSLGVACYPEHATSTSELLRAADTAMYEAKRRGRNRVMTAGPTLVPAPTRRPKPGTAAQGG
jgi:two-component system, cell cycle response regulator